LPKTVGNLERKGRGREIGKVGRFWGKFA